MFGFKIWKILKLGRKEVVRNEKIVRGLMKLPPNRRCINCNSLGTQYVCTNFWTFVCMTCSEIHREFTHRVKSVSTEKFTSQEVEALQKGGNQRARERYLKAWNPQRQMLPYIRHVDEVREFIKNVYVDEKYAVGTQSAASSRSVGSVDGSSMSKSVCSFDFLEAASESKQSAKTSHTKRSSLPSVSQHSVSENSDGLDLFSLPISSVQEPKKALPNKSPPEPKDLLRRTRSGPL